MLTHGQQGHHLVAALARRPLQHRGHSHRRRRHQRHDKRQRDPARPRDGTGGREHSEAEQRGQQVARRVYGPHDDFDQGERHQWQGDPDGPEDPQPGHPHQRGHGKDDSGGQQWPAVPGPGPHGEAGQRSPGINQVCGIAIAVAVEHVEQHECGGRERRHARDEQEGYRVPSTQ